ncbi:hypothetical protein [Bradyrhizobium valentinum]|uniref:hypothetical protein n=1 Tax=Bradyrhizobium valentinum TaxID=1518501 RepID=UPI0012E3BC5C|nr:hypothetical protein [Bradyrhizobium valentinum]
MSAALLYYALNSWIVAQGGNEVFGAKLVLSQRVPAAMVAILVCSVLAIASSAIGLLYARRGGKRWHERIPVVGFEAIDTASVEGRVYQGAMLALLSGLPFVAMIYFWYSLLTAQVMLNEGSKKLIGLWNLGWLWNSKLSDPARICTNFTEGAIDPCTGSATILPGVEPGLFACLSLLALFIAAKHWKAVVLRR